jgi:hypothetical protein
MADASAYIIYILEPYEEYVLGMHKWVLYSSFAAAVSALVDQWIDEDNDICGSWVYSTEKSTLQLSINVNDHKKVINSPSGFGGFIARVA